MDYSSSFLPPSPRARPPPHPPPPAPCVGFEQQCCWCLKATSRKTILSFRVQRQGDTNSLFKLYRQGPCLLPLQLAFMQIEPGSVGKRV